MVRTILSERKYASVGVQELRNAMDRSGALEKARVRADEYAKSARLALENLPDSEYGDSLRSLPAYILNRDR